MLELHFRSRHRSTLPRLADPPARRHVRSITPGADYAYTYGPSGCLLGRGGIANGAGNS
jgi:hypothetical protein